MQFRYFKCKLVSQPKRKNAFKTMRTERKQVESFSNNNSFKDPKTKKHPRSTMKCREESKKRQGERENTQNCLDKNVARKCNFTFLKEASRSNKEKRE